MRKLICVTLLACAVACGSSKKATTPAEYKCELLSCSFFQSGVGWYECRYCEGPDCATFIKEGAASDRCAKDTP